MRLAWMNGDTFFGTQEIEIQEVDPLEIKHYCSGLNVLGCHDLFGVNKSIIRVCNPFNSDEVLLETISHEILHAFCANDNHKTPLLPRNQEEPVGAPVLRTPKISSFYDLNLNKLGKEALIHITVEQI